MDGIQTQVACRQALQAGITTGEHTTNHLFDWLSPRWNISGWSRNQRGVRTAVSSSSSGPVQAKVLVTIALVLNSVIYAENVSTRDPNDSDDVAVAVETTFAETAMAMCVANRNEVSTDPSNAKDTFAADFETVGDAVARDRAIRGNAFEVDVRTIDEGYLLEQNVSQV